MLQHWLSDHNSGCYYDLSRCYDNEDQSMAGEVMMPGDRTACKSMKTGTDVDTVSYWANHVAGMLLMVMTFILSYEVISRKIFNSPTIWGYPATGFIFMWFPLLAASYGIKKRTHVTCDLFINRLSDESKDVLEIATDLVSLFFILCLAYSGWMEVADQYEVGARAMGLVSYPKWLLFISIPVGMTLCLVQVVSNVITRCADLKRERASKRALISSGSILIVSSFLVVSFFSIYLLTIFPAAGITLLTVVFILSGAPVAFSLGAVGCISLLAIHHGDIHSLSALAIITGDIFGSITLLAIPLFVLGGYVLSEGRLGEILFDIVKDWLSFLPGSMGAATVISGGLLAAMIGSSTAVTAIIAVVAVKPLMEAGYSKKLTYGTITGTSLGIIIPPSVGFVVYGYLTNTSVGKLFMAGVVPGILLVFLFSIYVIVVSMFSGIRPVRHITWREKVLSLKRSVFILFIPVLILGGIYLGVMTPTEASAILVSLSLLGLVIYGKFTLATLKQAIEKASLTASMILLIVLGAVTLAHVLAYMKIPGQIAQMVVSSHQPVFVIFLWIFAMYLILGMFLEGASMVALTVPVLAPMLSGLGLDMISFGVIVMLMVEIALLTPPIGLNLFVVKGIVDEPLGSIIKGSLPFLIILLSVAVFLALYPNVALWLPARMAY